MPFGAVNAPATFSRCMNDALEDFVHKCLIIYIKDLYIYSSTLEQHLVEIENVLSRLCANQFNCKLPKCYFIRSSVSFLGHIVGEHGISVDPPKISAITTGPRPHDVHEVRYFSIYAINYNLRFIENYAQLAAPLTDLLHKQTKFLWTDAHDVVFKCPNICSWFATIQSRSAFYCHSH